MRLAHDDTDDDDDGDDDNSAQLPTMHLWGINIMCKCVPLRIASPRLT